MSDHSTTTAGARRFVVTTDRIGRTRKQFRFEVELVDGRDVVDRLAEAIHARAVPFLGSRHVDTYVDLEIGEATVFVGGFRAVSSLRVVEVTR